MNVVILLFLLLPIAYFCFRSFLEYKKANTPLRFLQYGENLSSHDFFFTLTSSSSGLATVLYLVTVYGYFYGFPILPWIILFWLSTQIASHWTIRLAGDRVRSVTPYQDGFWEAHGTIHEFFGAACRSVGVRRVAAAMTILCYLILVAAECVLAYQITYASLTTEKGPSFAAMEFNFLAFAGIIWIVGLVILYTAASGFRAVIKTDEVQLTLILIMLVCAWIVFGAHSQVILKNYSTVYGGLSWESLINPTGQSPVRFLIFFVIANFVFWIAWWPTAMDQWHRCAATGSHQAPVGGIWGTFGLATTIYIIALSSTFCAIGVATRVLLSPDASDVAPLASYLNSIRPGGDLAVGSPAVAVFLAGCIVMGMIAAVTSTLDTYLAIVAQSTVSDVIASRHGIRSLWQLEQETPGQKRRYLAYCRLAVLLSTVPVAVFCAAIAFITSDTFVWVYIAFSFTMTFVPIVAIVLFAPLRFVRATPAITSIIGGALITAAYDIVTIVNIERLRAADDIAAMYGWYDILYLAPAIASISTLLIYLLGLALFRGGPSHAEQ